MPRWIISILSIECRTINEIEVLLAYLRQRFIYCDVVNFVFTKWQLIQYLQHDNVNFVFTVSH